MDLNELAALRALLATLDAVDAALAATPLDPEARMRIDRHLASARTLVQRPMYAIETSLRWEAPDGKHASV